MGMPAIGTASAFLTVTAAAGAATGVPLPAVTAATVAAVAPAATTAGLTPATLTGPAARAVGRLGLTVIRAVSFGGGVLTACVPVLSLLLGMSPGTAAAGLSGVTAVGTTAPGATGLTGDTGMTAPGTTGLTGITGVGAPGITGLTATGTTGFTTVGGVGPEDGAATGVGTEGLMAATAAAPAAAPMTAATTGLITGATGGGVLGSAEPAGGAIGLIAGVTGGGTGGVTGEGGVTDSSEIDCVRRGGATDPTLPGWICAVPVEVRPGVGGSGSRREVSGLTCGGATTPGRETAAGGAGVSPPGVSGGGGGVDGLGGVGSIEVVGEVFSFWATLAVGETGVKAGRMRPVEETGGTTVIAGGVLATGVASRSWLPGRMMRLDRLAGMIGGASDPGVLAIGGGMI
jgi:hypothetical protein